MIDLDWRDFAAIVTIASALSAFAVWVLRAKLSDDFARKADLTTISDRLGQLERGLRDVPSHGDVRALTDRLADMTTKVGVLEAHVVGVDNGIKRVEHDLRLLLTSVIIKEEKAP